MTNLVVRRVSVSRYITTLRKETFFNIIFFYITTLRKETFLKLVVVLWRLWHRRNSLLYGNQALKYEDIVPWCRSYLGDLIFSAKEVIPRHVSRFIRWIPPDEGFFKLNTDAASDSAPGVVGLSCVVRDWKGAVLFSDVKSVIGDLTPEMIVALVVLRGLQVA
ncbi:hypothetical protein ACOSQ3_029921 [Xanthoceras sorbifolium]